jgi:hypothetical protein
MRKFANPFESPRSNCEFAKYWPSPHRLALSQAIPEDPMPSLPIPVVTIGLLLASNVFMTFAWYGHLKFKSTP